MTRDEADELRALAREIEQRAFSYEKNIQRLDLARARRLRDVAGRLRFVAIAAEEGEAGEAVRREVLGLRLEAMAELLGEPADAPPLVSAPVARASGADVSPQVAPAPVADVVAIGRVRPRR